MNYQDISIHIANHRATVMIEREAHRNALRGQTIKELTLAFNSLASNKDVRCIVLRGAGTKAFCAGADLQELLQAREPNARREFFTSIATLISTMQSNPKPIICVIHGYALAGGLGLVAASDIVLCTPDAVFGLPEVKIGLAPLVVMKPLSSTSSRRLLSRLALTGERLPASDALAAGLVTEIVNHEAIEQRSIEYAQHCVNNAPEAVAHTKESIRTIHELTLDDLADNSALRSLSLEACEGIEAFNEKRKPKWTNTP
jgi:enoyl-CoA hydratase/carnithine racemase